MPVGHLERRRLKPKWPSHEDIDRLAALGIPSFALCHNAVLVCWNRIAAHVWGGFQLELPVPFQYFSIGLCNISYEYLLNAFILKKRLALTVQHEAGFPQNDNRWQHVYKVGTVSECILIYSPAYWFTLGACLSFFPVVEKASFDIRVKSQKSVNHSSEASFSLFRLFIVQDF